ncbi:MAG: peptidase, partial [Bacteroidia bacterium]|nr:peptidase [Bacteroidia bacterium]
LKPGIAVIGGTEGNYLAGRELSLGFAETLLKESGSNEIKQLLGSVTFYIFPDISPDASEQYFSVLKYDRVVNSRQTDNDRDFQNDEDPYEDLNGDGMITLIRVSDPAGNWTESSDDKRVMVPADLSKGQKGSYFVYSEGTDNDKDGNFNEDGQGGVNTNRNFTYNYEEYGNNSGYHAISEPETKAVADFLFDHFNIYMTIAYHEITGAKGNPQTIQSPGNFMDWAYFHYGRYSFSTPGWWYAADKGKNTEAAFLSFAAKNNIPDPFIPWSEIKHPDFPDKKTEVGGIKPFALVNPPADTLGDLIINHYKFITAIAAMHPELEFLDPKVENAGENIYRVTLKVHNKGLFATMAEAGIMNQWTRLMSISVDPGKGQTIISGQKIQRMKRLEGGGSAEFSWLVSGKGSVTINAGAINTGT